jgi:hypothetical protein
MTRSVKDDERSYGVAERWSVLIRIRYADRATAGATRAHEHMRGRNQTVRHQSVI